MADSSYQLDLTHLTPALIDCMADGVYVLDAERKLTFMNAAAEQLLGYRTADLRERDMHEAIHYLRPDGSPNPAGDCPLLAVGRTGKAIRADADVFVRADQTLLPVSYASAPVLIDGRIEGVVVLFRDITQEKLTREERERLLVAAESARSEAEAARERYRELIEAMPVHVWTAAPDGRLTYVSGRMAEFAGKSAATLVAEGVAHMAHPADALAISAAWEQSIATGSPLNVEARLLRGRDFKYLWHTVRAVPCPGPDGRIREWIGTNADIDTEKRATEARDASLALARIERERLMRVFTNAPAVMAVYRGPEHVITLVNPAWERFVGKRDVIGKRLRDVFPELDGQGVLEVIGRVFETGEVFRAHEMLVRLDRNGRGELEDTYWSFVLQQLPSDSAATTDVLAFAVEVTDQVRGRQGVPPAA